MKIFEALRKDHDKQRALMKVLVDTSRDSAVRAEFYVQLKHELQSNAAAEERHFYLPLIKHDESIGISRHGIAEHHQIEELIEQLDETPMDSSAWLVAMRELENKVLHHLEKEENQFFQVAGKIFDNEQKEVLAQKYTNAMQGY